MQKTINDIPLYDAVINGNDSFIYKISIVDSPAVESDFLVFEKDEKPMLFEIQNEEEHKILGVALRCDYPIYRRDENGYEYYIRFNKDCIEKAAEDMMRCGYVASSSLDHTEGQWYVEGLKIQQLFIKDSSKGISPAGFENISDGSMFALYKVDSIELWDKIKSGEYKGFSIEGWLSLEAVEEEQSEEEREIFELIEKINKKLKK